MDSQRVTKTNEGKLGEATARSPGRAKSPHLSAHLLHQLQQPLGNRAFGRLIQAKLKVSQPSDEYEQEADRVADQVMRPADDKTDGDVAAQSETITLIEAEGAEGTSLPIPQDDEASAPDDVHRKAGDGTSGNVPSDLHASLNSRLDHGSSRPMTR